MEKEEILSKIKEALNNPVKGYNSMGASENYYNAYYLLGKCFTEEELITRNRATLNDLIKLAEFAGEVFY